MLLGFELPNVPVPTWETWQQVDELRSSIVKVRPYHLTLSTREHIQQRKLAVILRNNADEGPAFDARARIDELRAAIEAVQTYTHRLYLVIDNEPNHTNNQAPASTDYWARIRQVFETLALEFPAVQFVSPPLAVAQNEAEWYAAGRAVIDLFDCVGVHLYGQTDNSLVTYALHLAGIFDKPLIADELGNTDRHLSPDNKAAAVASYVRQAAEAGVQAATIFIAKHPTPEWAYCTLPTERLSQIAASVPQEEPMPTQTDIIVTSPHQNPMVAPGSVLSVSGYATGIDGQGMLAAILAEDTRPGTPQYGEPTNVRGIPIAADGTFSLQIAVPNSTELPAAATLLLSTTEIDLAAFQRGEGWGDAYQEGFAVTIGHPVAEPVPETPTDEEHLAHSLANIHFGAGDAYNRTTNPIFLDIQRAVAAFKAGANFSWPQR